MREIDFLLNVNSLGVVVFEDGEAAMNDIREWILTPVGDIYGMPWWGNSLYMFRHYPANELLEIQIESHIATKLPVDIPFVTIKGIRVLAQGVDDIVVTINTSHGLIQEKLVTL